MKNGIKQYIEDHPITVLVVSVGAFVSLILNALALLQTLNPHNFFGAREVANEYYVELGTFPKEREARRFFEDLISLSESLNQVALSRPGECRIGIDPDQLFFARSDQESSRWIVGADRLSGQSEFRKAIGDIEKIESRLAKFTKANCGQELSPASSEMLIALTKIYDQKQAKPRYFSISRYSATHGVNLTNVSTDE